MNANPAVDAVLESVLGSYQLRVEITTDVRYCGRWFEHEPTTRCGQFHLITEGQCWVSGPMIAAPQALHSGDLIVFPSGMRHTLSAGPALDSPPADEACTTSMLCGELEFLVGAHHPIFSALPDYFIVQSRESSDGFRQLARLLADTVQDHNWGRQTLQNKLADSLFTMALCEYVHRATDPRGLLAALADPRLCRVLHALHAKPGEDWTLQSMAQLAGMSRTAFAEHFHTTLGLPPVQYLSAWRATEAKRLLRNKRFSVAAIAEKLGYRSEAAFRRFFKRMEGVGPGQVRAGRDEEGADNDAG